MYPLDMLRHVWLCVMKCSLPGSSVHEILQGKNTGAGCCALLRGSSWPRDPTHCIFCITCRFFTTEPSGKPHVPITYHHLPNMITRTTLRHSHSWGVVFVWLFPIVPIDTWSYEVAHDQRKFRMEAGVGRTANLEPPKGGMSGILWMLLKIG